jgi:uncharacterized protein YegP (UPF0339 family)
MKKNRMPGFHLHRAERLRLHKGNVSITREWYWILIAVNGKTLSTSEMYTRKRNAVGGIRSAIRTITNLGPDGFYDHCVNGAVKFNFF